MVVGFNSLQLQYCKLFYWISHFGLCRRLKWTNSGHILHLNVAILVKRN